MISPIKTALPLILVMLVSSAALAQAPGQIPGTQPPVAPVIVPPPPVAAPPVRSSVQPLPQPSYGIPPGVAGSSYGYRGGGSISPSVSYTQPSKRRIKLKRRRPVATN